jgi:hypothetical protein
MRTLLRRISAHLALLLLGLASAVSAQAVDPRQALAGTILQLQTGTPNPSWYGPELWQIIAYQTNNTGVYPQLAALGRVVDIVVTQHQQMPQGDLYAMTAKHQNGISSWVFGIGRVPPRTEYASFNIGAPSTPTPLPSPSTATPPPTGPTGPTPPVEKPGAASESCKKFPNLCP